MSTSSNSEAATSKAAEESVANSAAAEYQRVKQQGKGRPIISKSLKGWRFVAVGSRVMYGKWPAFSDFLLDHLKCTLGLAWGQSEMVKAPVEQHPLIKALAALDGVSKKHPPDPLSGLREMPEYGAVRAVFGLAYDLYLIAHHLDGPTDGEAFELLLSRLRQTQQFFGARHEARVAGMLLRSGFILQWEDEENDRSKRHGEFTATFPPTARSFWVECKMRQSDGSLTFTHLVTGALKKETMLDRLVFVELHQATAPIDPQTGGWVPSAIRKLRELEQQPNSAALPPAYIIVSNFPDYHYLVEVPEGAGMALEGFKTDSYRFEFAPLPEIIADREENPEIESLWRSIEEHDAIPTTFDGSILGIDQHNRLLIGNRYDLGVDGIGILRQALVQGDKAMCVMEMADGTTPFFQFDLTAAEVEAWRQHPETFFGQIDRNQSPLTNDPVDLYSFFAGGYANADRDFLLGELAGEPDIDALRCADQENVVKRFALRTTEQAIRMSGPSQEPVWKQRLRPRRK
ncbi:hypothetical protein [Pseudolysobacter antarcticus]|uniref:hypothetical protein n=1 Tax=Pseudolysobacter antarcticus TaxID=2511995 RepID=UPI001F5CDC30|nr:hypothetical protein [Pseudolysobacter antarcticus]